MSFKNETRLTPLFKKEWGQTLKRMNENEHAPKWNAKCGDRLTKNDIPFIKDFEESLHNRVKLSNYPQKSIIDWINLKKNSVLWFQEVLEGINVEKDFYKIPFMVRGDLQSKLEYIVPLDIDLKDIVINPTSGTTGQPILCPNHPKSIGCYDPLIQFSLKMHGISQAYDHNIIAAIQLCYQKSTMTYNTVHSYLNGAGFAKINLNYSDWRKDSDVDSFINSLSPVFLSGDPLSFLQATKMALSYRPKALVSTAITFEKPIYEIVKNYFNCPIVNLYSLNETGIIGYSCPLNPYEFHIVSGDIFVEVVGEDGKVCEQNEIGEIVFTGGRNPFLPLLRYKTGDYASIDYSECQCGDRHPRLKNLTARKIVLFYDLDKNIVNSIDISKILREYPVLRHQFVQKSDYSCKLYIDYNYTVSDSDQREILDKILQLFNNRVDLTIIQKEFDLDTKTIPFLSEVKK